MATGQTEFYTSDTVAAEPRAVATRAAVRKFATAAGSPTLARLTPVARNTSTGQWVAWTNGGANGTGTIKGFVWSDNDGLALDASDETLGVVMLEGQIHHDDVPVPSGESQGNLTTALQAETLRELGIFVQGTDSLP